MYLIGNQLDKRLFLWSLFIVQVLLIGGFLLFGSAVLFPGTGGGADNQTRFVDFVHRPNDIRPATQRRGGDVRLETGGRYEHEFVGGQHCFRDGLARRFNASDSSKGNSCICKSDYHGRDCGQPEVLWRAFMTSKIPLKMTVSRRQPHSVFYIIETGAGALASFETLEVQLMELMHVVDLFVLCDETINYTKDNQPTKEGAFEQQTRLGTLKSFRHKILMLNGVCTLKSMYKALRNAFKSNQTRIRSDDVLLVSRQDEILNWRAVKYFKWYDEWPQPTQFRLKYLIYGYYWQHPQSTRLGSAACQISVLDEVYKSDPRKIISATKPGMIIGDLNHVGGWFCQYCYHPLNIVKKLLAERSEHMLVQQHRGQAEHDGSYIESLIANGLFIDGKLGLTRLHRFADKYYAPDYIRNASWKYENVLSNVYATYDDDYAN